MEPEFLWGNGTVTLSTGLTFKGTLKQLDHRVELEVDDHVQMNVWIAGKWHIYGRCKITFLGLLTDRGPRGFRYLPYRAEEKRWATPRFDLMGNDIRFAICYPAGAGHRGQMVDPHSFVILPPV